LPGLDGGGIRQHLAEAAAGQIGNGGNRLGVTQQALRREDDQRLAHAAPVRAAVHLTAQQVEILGRRGAIGDLHIVAGAKHQEALDARAGMLRPLPFEAMRQ
jgi:hypothetical protein